MRRRRAIAALALVAITIASGCTIPRPAGDGPLRYRDQVFTDVTVTRDLQYGSALDAQGVPVPLHLDLYRPAGDTQTRRPAVVWVHGGGFTSGSKTAANVVDAANTFARLGYVAVSINYRLLAPAGCSGNPSQPVCTTAALEAKRDAQAAVRWLRANADTLGIDPTRIGIGGTSAGAITATLVGLFSEDEGSSGNPGYPSTVGGFISVAGGLPDGLFASPGDAWGLLFHGTADTVVPPSWSAVTAAKMLNAGVPAWLQQQEGAGHVPWAQYRGLYLEQSAYFLYLALDLAHAAGQPAAAARALERQAERLGDRYPRLEQRYEHLLR
jgi:dienelactone hydrolase